MKRREIEELINRPLSDDEAVREISSKLEQAGVTYSFSTDFREKVVGRIFNSGDAVYREFDSIKSWNLAFYRIALTGAAAIVILLISLYLSEGSFSFNTILGISDTYDESILSLLTGN